MKKFQVRVGSQVVMNANRDATLYDVVGINEEGVQIKERQSKRATPKTVDASLLRMPTIDQLLAEEGK